MGWLALIAGIVVWAVVVGIAWLYESYEKITQDIQGDGNGEA